MNRPLVSVLIPAYNAEKHIDRCLESVVNQTYDKLEIIIVDDGSTDRTAAKAETWAAKDNRMQVIHQTDCGLFYARRKAVESCLGSYIMFIDCDDYLAPDAVEVLLKHCIKHNNAIASADFYFVYGDRKEYFSYNPSKQNNIITDHTEIMKSTFNTVLWNKMFSAELVKNIPHIERQVTYKEDTLQNFFYSKNAEILYIINEPIYYYVQHSESLTGDKRFSKYNEKFIEDSAYVFNTVIEAENNPVLKEHYSAVYLNLTAVLLEKLTLSGKYNNRIKDVRGELKKYFPYVKQTSVAKKRRIAIWFALYCYPLFKVGATIKSKVKERPL